MVHKQLLFLKITGRRLFKINIKIFKKKNLYANGLNIYSTILGPKPNLRIEILNIASYQGIFVFFF